MKVIEKENIHLFGDAYKINQKTLNLINENLEKIKIREKTIPRIKLSKNKKEIIEKLGVPIEC